MKNDSVLIVMALLLLLIETESFYFLMVDYRMKLATQLVVNKKRHSA